MPKHLNWGFWETWFDMVWPVALQSSKNSSGYVKRTEKGNRRVRAKTRELLGLEGTADRKQEGRMVLLEALGVVERGILLQVDGHHRKGSRKGTVGRLDPVKNKVIVHGLHSFVVGRSKKRWWRDYGWVCCVAGSSGCLNIDFWAPSAWMSTGYWALPEDLCWYVYENSFPCGIETYSKRKFFLLSIGHRMYWWAEQKGMDAHRWGNHRRKKFF